ASAEAGLVAAVQRAPADAAGWLALGHLYLEDGKPFEALWCLREAQRQDPKSLSSRILLARALAAAQLYRPAVNALQALIREHPDDGEGPHELARLQLS